MAPRSEILGALLRKTAAVLEMIKFGHSVFALPFAMTAALLAIRGRQLSAPEIAWKLLWITLAMVAARSAAMAFNRVVDAAGDARNPRTQTRAIPAGLVSIRFTWGFIVVSCLVFVTAAAMLNPLCLRLSVPALAVVLGYSYAKRFTVLAHWILGFALGIAPAAAWIAVRGSLSGDILFLSAAVMLWTAGFDIIYSCQDMQFDRSQGLRSLPAKLGVGAALWVSRSLHAGMVALLVALWSRMELGAAGLLGIGVTAALLIYEHTLVDAEDLSRVNAAFFTVNGWISVLFFAFWAADVWLG